MNEFEEILLEATKDVEKELEVEDKGWLTFGNYSSEAIDLLPALRPRLIRESRKMYSLDPLAKRAIRLWTDYTFGNGISLQSKDKNAQDILNAFWKDKYNRPLTSAKGQRKSSDKLLVDGEIFFALFIGPDQIRIRWIDPLEITEIITDPDDIETPMYYKRTWCDALGRHNDSIYRSWLNINGESVDWISSTVQVSDGAIVYHLEFNSIGHRGAPLLLCVLDWIAQYRRFLASRIAIVRALARFAWKQKVKGGSTAVAATKTKTEGKYPQAASTLIENEGVDTQPIKTSTGGMEAKDDGRMIKLQVCAGVGIPEQYFGDIATGNLATAKTVELPLLKQFGSHQQLWADAYTDILNIIFESKGIKNAQVDIDFPPIAPEDTVAAMTAITNLVQSFPQFADMPEIQRQALMSCGINNIDQALEGLSKLPAKEAKHFNLIKALQELKEALHDIQR